MSWSKNDNEFLRNNYEKLTISEIAKVLNKTEKSVQTKLGYFKKYELQNKKFLVKPNSANQSYWTKEQEEFVLQNYSILSCKEIGQTIGKSQNNVRQKILSYGLEIKRTIREKQSSNWNNEEIEFLKQNYTSMTRLELSKILGKTENIIRTKLIDLDLKKTKKSGNHESWSKIEDNILTSICKDKNINKNDKMNIVKMLLSNRSKLSIYRRIGNLKLRKFVSKLETLPEKIVRQILEKHKIDFVAQVKVPDTRYIIDFCVRDIAIEVQGDYWHCNPKIYKNGPKDKIQTRKIQDDKNKKAILEDKNYKVVYLWENDIINKTKDIETQILKIINEANDET